MFQENYTKTHQKIENITGKDRIKYENHRPVQIELYKFLHHFSFAASCINGRNGHKNSELYCQSNLLGAAFHLERAIIDILKFTVNLLIRNDKPDGLNDIQTFEFLTKEDYKNILIARQEEINHRAGRLHPKTLGYYFTLSENLHSNNFRHELITNIYKDNGVDMKLFLKDFKAKQLVH